MPDSKRQITAQEATIKTASIEVKVLTLNGKQMTLAVFKQLPEEVIVDQNTCSLSGIPWGKVNYHPDCPKDAGTHLHIVWQKEDRLCRSIVYSNPPSGQRSADLQRDVGEAFKIFTAVMTLAEDWKPSHVEKDRDGEVRVVWQHDGKDYRFWLGGTELQPFWWLWHSPHTQPERDAEARKALQDLIASVGLNPEAATRQETLARIVRPTVEAWEGWRRKWKATYAELEALDQLFIAV